MVNGGNYSIIQSGIHFCFLVGEKTECGMTEPLYDEEEEEEMTESESSEEDDEEDDVEIKEKPRTKSAFVDDEVSIF